MTGVVTLSLRKVVIFSLLAMVTMCCVLLYTVDSVGATSSQTQYAAIDIKQDDFKNIPSPQSGTQIFTKILNAVYTIVAAICVIVIAAAGIIYITSEGESQKTKMAKDAIIYALVGLLIVGSAFIITGVIQAIAAKPPTTP